MTKLVHPSQNIYAPYWLVGDKKIYNQFEATKTAFVDGGPAYRFVFLENEYDQLDWTQEPKETWEELCFQRAVELRQKYRKLKLLFTAGRDSGHVWRVFEKFKIPIDELILIYTPQHPLRKFEHEQYIQPIAEYLCRQNPQMKFRVLELGKTQTDLIMGNSDWLEAPTANQALMTFLPQKYGEVLTNMDPDAVDPTVGYITGMEKPRLQLINGEYIFRHLDVDASWIVFGMPNLEWFYWAPEMPQLHLKQCWMGVNYLEDTYPGCTPEFVATFQDTHKGYYDEWCLSIGRGPAMSWECGNGIHKVRDNYHWSLQSFMNVAKDEKWRSYSEWNSMMQDLARNYSHCFNDNDPMKGSIGIWGKPYFIKKQKIT